MSDLPAVSIIMPVFDEAQTIDECLASLAAQDYTGSLEVIVADGGSTDGTLERLESWHGRLALTVVDNPDRNQSIGLNLAAGAARGEILVRMDAHTAYAPDYVSASVRALLGSDAVAVGGPMRPEGSSWFGRGVAAAMRSIVATGPGKFHREGPAGEVDTVYLGAFRRDDFLAIGGFRRFRSGAGEDADLYHRWRRVGRRVVLDPDIRSTYRPRSAPGRLLRQHRRYGQAKAELLWVNGSLPSWRPLAPAALVVGLAACGAIAAVTGWLLPLVVLAGVWLVVVLAAALASPRSAVAMATATVLMHLAYGAGFWWGLLRGRRTALVA